MSEHFYICTDGTQGEVENKLLDFAGGHPGFKLYIMRPGMVLSREVNLRSLVFGLGSSVRVDALTGRMVDLALKGGDKDIWENADINEGV